jgi:glycerol-3-phosphate dehydrogenase
VIRYGDAEPSLLERVSPFRAVLKAEVVHAMREEMAQTLQDVVFRRTELGALGHPGHDALQTCVALMAGELGWDAARVMAELEETEEAFARHGARTTHIETVSA